jgi:hypothetical protein
MLFFLFTICLVSNNSWGQIASYNQFPTHKPPHILDEKLTKISFSFSMRVLESNYTGPIIRLRRSTDNAERIFGRAENDIVDIAAINAWRGTSSVFVHTWYDQSGLGRDAIQTTTYFQPQFYPDATRPYFQGDGVDDHLLIDTPNGVQDVTNAGDEGTVITIARATNRNQHSFGVLINSNRWSTHINWRDRYLYFDPGIPSSREVRKFYNNSNVNRWELYTFIKTNTNAIARAGGARRFDGAHTMGKCTLTIDFAIGWANGNQARAHSNTSFIEFIMYRTDISAKEYQEIEENAITFWGI